MTEFEAIYAEHFDGVYRYVFSLCRSEALAEEITQQAFFKAMQHLDRFDGRCRLYVWLCQIAKNTWYTHLKKQKRFADSTPADPAAPQNAQPPDYEDALLEKESAWRLHQRLHRLEEPYKEVFSLRVFGELSFSQIGTLFGKTDSWARLVFYRAKIQLRREFDEDTV